MARPLRIGTRSSALALAQTAEVAAAMRRHGQMVEIVPIRTTGDREQRDPSTLLGTGIFVKELEEALLAGRIDLAVHSAKDLPTAETAGLAVAAFLARGDPHDALVGGRTPRLHALPAGGKVGTDSPRRRAFLLAARPDLEIAGIRGNVDTRLRKLAQGRYDAIVVAAIGLRRLGLADRIGEVLPPDVMLPAVGQGAIAVQARTASAAATIAAALDHLPTRQELAAERAFLRTVGGGCRAPIAALARSDGAHLTLEGAVISPDGRRMVRDRLEGPAGQSAALGLALAEALLSRGAAGVYQGSRA